MPDPALRAGLVLLRPWSRDDVPAIVAACQDPAIARFSPVIPFPYAESDALTWLASQEPRRLAGEGFDLAVVHRESGSVLGAIGLGSVSTKLCSASIGYWLAAEARGHGYVTTATRMLARWAFDTVAWLALNSLQTRTTLPRNVSRSDAASSERDSCVRTCSCASAANGEIHSSTAFCPTSCPSSSDACPRQVTAPASMPPRCTTGTLSRQGPVGGSRLPRSVIGAWCVVESPSIQRCAQTGSARGVRRLRQ